MTDLTAGHLRALVNDLACISTTRKSAGVIIDRACCVLAALADRVDAERPTRAASSATGMREVVWQAARRCFPSFPDRSIDEITDASMASFLAAREANVARAERRGREAAAKLVEGEVYKERYRTWPFCPVDKRGERGNQAEDSFVVRHCDQIAAAIRALPASSPVPDVEGVRPDDTFIVQAEPARTYTQAEMDAAYYAALELCVERYRSMGLDVDWFEEGVLQRLPLRKLNRWLGFVQGKAVRAGRTSVEAERDWTRPLFAPLDFPDRARQPSNGEVGK